MVGLRQVTDLVRGHGQNAELDSVIPLSGHGTDGFLYYYGLSVTVSEWSHWLLVPMTRLFLIGLPGLASLSANNSGPVKQKNNIAVRS